jgi:glycine/D-amino acid oxidase-like deaminating enzyme
MADAVDLLVIGGGINGAGIARDAAGRGLSVVLCDKGDLGPIYIQDSHWCGAMIPCVPGRVIRSTKDGQAIRAF